MGKDKEKKDKKQKEQAASVGDVQVRWQQSVLLLAQAGWMLNRHVCLSATTSITQVCIQHRRVSYWGHMGSNEEGQQKNSGSSSSRSAGGSNQCHQHAVTQTLAYIGWSYRISACCRATTSARPRCCCF